MDILLQKLTLPDLWQQQAVRALRHGKDVIVDAPTGAGKTRVFELLVEDTSWRKHNRQAVFTVPTRALANDKFAEWQDKGWNVGIATGDLAVNTQAPVLVATLETQRERFLNGQGPSVLVVDEYQMISDATRGLHYELIMTLAPPDTQLLLLSGSVGNPDRIANWLTKQGRQVELITAEERPVPLDDVHILGLPLQAPKFIKGFWARLAAEVLLADMAPLLIFVPHR
ncbi:MAG: superfamily II RNA helicase, partial [Verrucomicrobiales bacterium]